MLPRKINAVLGLLSTFLILDHAIFNAVWMLSRGGVEKSTYMSWALAGLVLIHAFISIDQAISAHTGVEKHKCKQYPKMNVSTMIQRISGVLMVIFAGLHVAGATGYLQPPKMVHAILPILFFALVFAHVVVSTGKAFITLGIGNAKLVKVIDVVIKVICVATFIADITGFYLYLV